MDAVPDKISDVDSAGVYFISVEEFEHREPSDGTPEPSGKPADEDPMESATRADPLQEDPAAALRRSRGHSTEASSS